jgi:Domain of unknown function (DUF929)
MVDWDWVDRARSEGWSWKEIAEDPRSEFQPDRTGVPASRQLRTQYRMRPAAPVPENALTAPPESHRGSRMARFGWGAFALLAPWAVLAFFFPSPVGVYLPVIPLLGLFAAAAGIILAIGLLRSTRKWTPEFRTYAIAGLVAGLVIAGGLGVYASSQGCPFLSPFTTAEPGGWVRSPGASWEIAGAPVVFFYGSVACPFCSASSWAVLGALDTLGNVSGVVYDHSSSSDIYPNTPSVVLSDVNVSSPYLTLDARESTSDSQIMSPPTGRCIEQGYLSAYDPIGAIPFIALGGVFVHTDTLVDPAALASFTASQIAGQLQNHSGGAYIAISGAETDLLAYLVWLNGDRPANVATEPAVAAVIAQIR